MAEGARLESVYTATYRGFESLPHRQIAKTDLMVGFLFLSAILMWCWQGRVKTLAQSALSRLLGI